MIDSKKDSGAPTGIPPTQVAGTTMKAVQMYSPYGYRAKIGVIVPSTNTVAEPEFNMMAPHGVSIHSNRILRQGLAGIIRQDGGRNRAGGPGISHSRSGCYRLGLHVGLYRRSRFQDRGDDH